MKHLAAGLEFDATGVRFTVASHHADALWLCLFDESGNKETKRIEMERAPGGLFTIHVKGITKGQLYGYRADGEWAPWAGHRYDISKLLVDPHATRLDRAFVWSPELGAKGVDTGKLTPKAILEEFAPQEPRGPEPLQAAGLIYEVPVKAFTKLNLDIPEAERGLLTAIAHPSSIAHFKKLGVAAVELMPITAWIDERHLAPHHLTNAWGYNPVSFLALDPRLAPGGIADLRLVAEALHKEGIALILDVVFNHTGESDLYGPVLSLRGLDNALYYRHHADEPGALVNDTGTGNTLAVERAPVRDLVMAALRHFVTQGHVDGFRFDLGTTLGRTARGFSPHAPLFEAMRHDAVLTGTTLIAEPWDIGPGGYQLGQFPPQFLEWNDRYRDDVRRFWRGDPGTLGALATRLCGSSDYFKDRGATTRSVNLLAAHDGFTLADLTSYRRKHNMANGENDMDGHGENFSWNHGAEGATSDRTINAMRSLDAKALLALLFVSRGTMLLTAGDEFGRSQRGNNNAYAQDNAITWLDWVHRDKELEDFVAALAKLRLQHRTLQSAGFLSGHAPLGFDDPDISWFRADGQAMETANWENPENRFLGFVLSLPSNGIAKADQIAVVINRNEGKLTINLPKAAKGAWQTALTSQPVMPSGSGFDIRPYTVAIFTLVSKAAPSKSSRP